jgi:hypothetical protein
MMDPRLGEKSSFAGIPLSKNLVILPVDEATPSLNALAYSVLSY